MDIVRLILWHGYIQSKTLPYYTVLGYFHTFPYAMCLGIY